jgi:hypothetical protein
VLSVALTFQDGAATDEAVRKAADWAWEQLSEAEREELAEKWKMEVVAKRVDEYLDKLIAEGKAEKFTGAEGEVRFRIFDGS